MRSRVWLAISIFCCISCTTTAAVDQSSDVNSTPAQKSSSASADKMGSKRIEGNILTLCKHSNEVRSIRVEKSDEGCEAVYSKSNSKQLIGKSMYPKGCEAYVDQVISNLESSNWKCKTVKEGLSELKTPTQAKPNTSRE